MALKNRMKTDPIPVVRQSRELKIRDIVTAKPGKMTPIAAFNLLRMDSSVGRINVAVTANETYELLLNKLYGRVTSWFVPHVALERFGQSPTIFERSFHGEPMTDVPGAPVVPFIQLHGHGAAGANEVYKSLGLSAKPGTAVNDSYLESYNQIVNYVRRQRSKSLEPRDLLSTTLAAALWGSSTFSNIVPDFDDGMIAGEMPLTVLNPQFPVRGLARNGTPFVGGSIRTDTGEGVDPSQYRQVGVYEPQNFPEVYAEMEQNGLVVSLANIDQAQKLRSFAKLREQYEGHKDAWIIDSLMSGLEVPDQMWFQPMMLDSQLFEIRQAYRPAMDGANLEEGVANGVGGASVSVNVPPNTYGGVIMIMLETFPEQLYERQADPWFMANSVDDLPDYFKDVTNPMPVVKVFNKEVDVDHDTPDALFGFAERNWKWRNWPTRVGGDFFAPDADASTNVIRRAIYATDEENPTLSESFYTAENLGREVFVDQVNDPFKVGVGGIVGVTGLTVIGEVYESEANYDEVRSKVPPLQPVS